LSTGRVAGGKPFDFKLRGDLVRGGGDQGRVGNASTLGLKAAAQATVDEKLEVYDLQKLELTLTSSQAEGKAPLAVTLNTAGVHVDLAAQTVQVQPFQAVAGGAHLNGVLSGTGIPKAPKFSGHLTLAEVSPRELLPQLGVAVPITRDPNVLQKLSFEAALQATTDSVTLSDLSLQLDDVIARGSLGLSPGSQSGEPKALRFDLEVDRVNADRYLPPKPAGKDKAAAKARQPTEIPIDLIRSLNVQGDLRVGEAVFAGIKFSKLRLGVNAHEGVMRLYPSQASMYGGSYSGDIRVDATGKEAKLSLDEHVSGIDFAPLCKDFFDTQRISGRGAATLKGTGVGRTTDDAVKSLDGSLDFNVANGALEGVDLWYEIRRARALIRREAPPPRTGPERTAFQTFKGSGVIKEGVLRNQDLVVDTQYLKIAGQGTFGLATQTVDYHLTANVLRLPQEGAEAKDLVDASIPIVVSGTLGALKVLPDFEGYVKTQGKQRLEEEKKKLEEKVRDKLQDKLKGILGGH
jgi:AsmA protein